MRTQLVKPTLQLRPHTGRGWKGVAGVVGMFCVSLEWGHTQACKSENSQKCALLSVPFTVYVTHHHKEKQRQGGGEKEGQTAGGPWPRPLRPAPLKPGMWVPHTPHTPVLQAKPFRCHLGSAQPPEVMGQSEETAQGLTLLSDVLQVGVPSPPLQARKLARTAHRTQGLQLLSWPSYCKGFKSGIAS